MFSSLYRKCPLLWTSLILPPHCWEEAGGHRSTTIFSVSLISEIRHGASHFLTGVSYIALRTIICKHLDIRENPNDQRPIMRRCITNFYATCILCTINQSFSPLYLFNILTFFMAFLRCNCQQTKTPRTLRLFICRTAALALDIIYRMHVGVEPTTVLQYEHP